MGVIYVLRVFFGQTSYDVILVYFVCEICLEVIQIDPRSSTSDWNFAKKHWNFLNPVFIFSSISNTGEKSSGIFKIISTGYFSINNQFISIEVKCFDTGSEIA